MTTAVASLVGCIVGATACSASHADLPPVQGTSPHFRYHARLPEDVQSDVLARLERHRSDMHAYLELHDERVIDYYLFADESDLRRHGPCTTPTDCTSGGSVFTSAPMHEHELLHSYLASVGLPPAPTLEGMAESLGCLRDAGSTTVERDWRRVVAEYPTSDPAIYASAQRLMKYLLEHMGVSRTIAYYGDARFTLDPALFSLQFAQWWGRPFDDVWAAAIGTGSLAPSAPVCPCLADPVSAGAGELTISHPNDADYRPLAASSPTLVLDFSSTGGALVQDCARRGPSVRLLGTAVEGHSVAIVRTDGGAHFLSFPSRGTEVLTASDFIQIESTCAAASSVAVGGPLALTVAGPRSGARWYLRVATTRALTMTRLDANTSGLRACTDCGLSSCQALGSLGDSITISDGAILELTPDASGGPDGLDAASAALL